MKRLLQLNVFELMALAELPIVSIAIGISFLKTSFLPFVVILEIFFWIIRWFAYKRISCRTPADWTILLMVLMIPVTIWLSPLVSKTLLQVYRLLGAILLFYAVVNWSTTKQHIEWMFIGVVILGSALSLLAPFMVKWETHKVMFLPDWIYQRFTILVSDTVNPSVLAGSLVFLLPFPLAMLIFTWPKLSKKFRGFLLVSSILMILVLILTQSRGGWLTFFIVLAILPVFRWRYGWIGLLIIGCGLIILNFQLGFKHVLDLLIASKTLQSLDGRIEVWSRAVYMIKDFSWTGIGFGLFGDVADQMYPFIQFPPGTIVHAHNLFLQIALDLGIPGLIAWLGTWLLVLYAGWRLYRIGCHTKDLWVVGLGVAILCSQVALGVFGISDVPNWGMIRTVPIVWAVWGFVMAGLCVYDRYSNENGQ